MENSTSFYEFVGFQPPQASDTGGLDELSIDPSKVALFSDFDGTIVEIAPRPDAIRFTGEDADLFAAAMKSFGGAVAIVSGRNLDDVRHYVGDFDGAISGGHGTELRIEGETERHELPDPERLEHIKAAVAEFAVIDPRIILEEKTYGVVLHFRQNPEMEFKARKFAECLLEGSEDFELQPAKMALEIKPKNISKAGAIEKIMLAPQFFGRTPIYVGDDATDETAFAYVNEQDGISIKIGDGPTLARYRTDSPASFKKWLGGQMKKRRN
jgi:trehalose 6-phosphate phosphatase